MERPLSPQRKQVHGSPLLALRDDRRLPSNHQCIPISHVRKAGASPRRGLPEIARDRAAPPPPTPWKSLLVEGKRVRRCVPKKWHTIRKEKGTIKNRIGHEYEFRC